jgi:beta-barrel assembly-enhancing protease
MFQRRGAAILLIFSLLLLELSCKRMLGDKSGSDGYAGAQNRPAPHFKPGFNLFTPDQDVELGKQSAQEVTRQASLINDERILSYVRQLGAKLAAKAPGYNFPYQFNVIATKEINAFALPGGFVFINAGAIAAAHDEGELAGVMAHEISHIALRHPTNQVSKAYIAQKGLHMIGRGGEVGQILEQLGGAGANLLFLKFGRTAESQADLEGVRIMAEAGYDPRDMANFFKTIEAEGGERVPQFLSDHPDPGNRVEAINNELSSLHVSSNPTHDTNEFEQAKGLLTSGATALSQSAGPERKGTEDPGDMKQGARPESPSANMREFQARDGSFTLQYPENWDALSSDDSNMIFAPQGAYGQIEQGLVVTHGLFVGAVAPQSSDLEAANSAFVKEQINMNQDFRVARAPQRVQFGGRQGFATVVAGQSTISGVMEIDVIYTTATDNGKLFYLITIVPEDEAQTYQTTFDRIVASLRLGK